MKSQRTKLIIVNILVLITFISCLELFMYNIEKARWLKVMNLQNKVSKREGSKNELKPKFLLMKKFDYEKYKRNFRPINYSKNSKKKPVIFFGCSYTQGAGLSNEQTLAYKVSKLTNRTTYNRGIGGTGTQFMLYQLKRNDFYKEIPQADAIIYTYISYHLGRLYTYRISPWDDDINLRYEYKNGELKEITPKFVPLYSLFTTRVIQDYIVRNFYIDKNKNFELFFIIMKECLRLARIHYPNVKFVILLYLDPTHDQLNATQVKRFEDAGFIVVDAEKIVGHELRSDKYRIEDKDHPSEKAWDEVAPKLTKKLNL